MRQRAKMKCNKARSESTTKVFFFFFFQVTQSACVSYDTGDIVKDERLAPHDGATGRTVDP